MEYDVAFIHPPSIFDFRKKDLFSGPLTRTVWPETFVYTVMPFGFLTMAAFLEKNGFEARVYNLGAMMQANASFNAERFISRLESKVFGIDLHWCAHSQGAIETARLIKKYHPNAFVLLGGYTATRFHKEIISKFPFVDAVIRGEAEKPVVRLAKAICRGKDLAGVTNLTSRGKDGRISINPWEKVCNNLDDYDFHRYDLLEPKISARDKLKGKGCLGIPICRGCPYNCVSCGGSAYSCKTLLHRDKPAFRSPHKIVEDMQKLSDQGFKAIGLFHDLRLGGSKYWKKLLSLIKKERLDIRFVVIELYTPADRQYLNTLASVFGSNIMLQISPESGNDAVRRAHGRKYKSTQLLKTASLAAKLHMQMVVFFMIGLANETRKTMIQTFNLCKKLFSMKVMVGEGLMVQLDPGSLAFDHPQQYGYQLIHKNFEDIYFAMQTPLWTKWMGYETRKLKRSQLIELYFETIRRNANARYELERYSKFERFKDVYAEKYVIEQVEKILAIKERETEKKGRLHELHQALLAYNTLKPCTVVVELLNKIRFKGSELAHILFSDRYGYRRDLKKIWKNC